MSRIKFLTKEIVTSNTLKMASSKPPEMNYTCEICGLEGFNDEEMRSHMVQYHLQGAANCPFCDLGEISPTEMLVHVNSAHLDYLTPRYAFFLLDGMFIIMQ